MTMTFMPHSMRLIVRTKQLLATDNRGARIVARCQVDGKIVRRIFPYRYDVPHGGDNFPFAALSLLHDDIMPKFNLGVRSYYSDFDREGGVLIAVLSRNAPKHLTAAQLLELEGVDLMEDANNFFSQETMQ